MTKILCPVDFSNTSKNALKYAANLFGIEPLEITILHIFGTESNTLMFKSIDGILRRDAEFQFEGLLKEMKNEFPNIEFNKILRKNYPVSTISDLGNSGDYDFIVMGTKGVSGLKTVFMGSIAGGVVAKSSSPVIVVPLDYAYEGLKEIVFAVGENPITDLNKLDPLRKIMRLHSAHLEILNISDKELTNKKDILRPFEEFDPTFIFKKSSDDLNRTINVHIQNHDKDLLCLLRRKNGLIDRFFKGSVTLKQTFNSAVPLLIIHNK